MRFFIDTADFHEIEQAVACGIICGVTTNPTLIAKAGHKDFHAAIHTICEMVDGPVSAEVIATDWQGMVSQAKALAGVHRNVVVKIPMTEDGLKATKILHAMNLHTNLTLIFSAPQALLAARAGATYVSPFVGRLDDIGQDGMQLVRDIADIFALHGIETKMIAASIRHPVHVTEAAKAGADIATVPWKTLQLMMKHPLTDAGLKRFLDDWNALQSKD